MRGPGPALAVLVVLAGCLGGTAPPEASPGPDGVPPGPVVTREADVHLGVTMERPDWSVGTSWVYAVEVPGEPVTPFRMVVAEDLGDAWLVATDDRGAALHHALYKTNPMLGRTDKATFSPFQDGRPVDMFPFPLADGKTWSATLFGESATFVATYADAVAVLPGEFLPGFHIVAQGPSGQRVAYNYVEAVGWFTDFQVRAADGTKPFHLTLRESGPDHAGPYWFIRGRPLLDVTLTETVLPLDAPAFELTPDLGFDAVGLAVVAEGTGETGALANVTVRGPDGLPAYSELFFLPRQEMQRRIVELPFQEGTWTVEVLAVASVRVEVHASGLIYAHQGTV